MPRNARCVQPNFTYHVTQRGTDRKAVFFTSADRRTYLHLAHQNLADAGVTALGFCLMTNHVHWLVRPQRSDSLAIFFQRLHGRYAQYINIRRQRSGHLWQNRFYSCPVSDRALWRVMRYVETNPVRACIVPHAGAYRWSSASAHLSGADPTGLLDLEFSELQGGPQHWRELLAEAETGDQLRLIRRCTYAGRPLGDQQFLDHFEEEFNRKWRRWGFEQLAAGTAAEGAKQSSRLAW